MVELRTRLLLDNNVWRAVADTGQEKELRSAAVHAGCVVQIAPAVVYEALRTPDPIVRDRLARVMTGGSWQRLMPEAFEEIKELRTNVGQTHPEWMRPVPRRAEYERQRMDWAKPRDGFWDRVRVSPGVVSTHVITASEGQIEEAREDTLVAREHGRATGFDFNHVRLKEIFYGHGDDPLRSDPAPAWAVTGMMTLRRISKGGAYWEWLDPWVDTSICVQCEEPWIRYWLTEVQPEALPRWWLRWAFEFLQTLRRVGAGTPVDAQLGSNMTECDYFVSADRRMIEICGKVRSEAPFKIGVPFLVGGGSDSCKDLMIALRDGKFASQRAAPSS